MTVESTQDCDCLRAPHTYLRATLSLVRVVLLALALTLAGAHISEAESTVTVTLNDQGQMLAQQLGLSVDELIQRAKDRIDELYRVSRIDSLLRSVGNTAAFAQRGLTVDYDVDRGDLLFGATAGGVHGDVAIGTTNTLLGGSIVNFGAMTGMNLDRWHVPAVTVFAGGFYEQTTIHGLAGHLLTLGVHGQYQILPARKHDHVHWTGLAVTSGIEYAHWTVGAESAIESHFTAQGPTEHATVHMSSVGTLDVLTNTYTVPIEVTTGVRAGPLSIYGGGGLDLTTGNSTITANLSSVLSINADHLPVGMAVITGSGEAPPSTVSVHALAGIGVHTRHARVYLQGALAPGETAVSVALRLAF